MTNSVLTNVFKNILKQNGLVDSGKLVNSIKVDTNLNDDTIIVNIISLPYLIYLNKDYNLVKQFSNTSEFQNEVGGIFLQLTEKIVSDILSGKPIPNIEPQVIVKINNI